MSLGGLFGNNTTAAATPATDPGLQPNKFALQMFENGTGGRPSPIGFDTPGLVGQLRGLMPQGGTPAPTPTPAAPAPVTDKWSQLGPLGEFFRMIENSPGNKLMRETQEKEIMLRRMTQNLPGN